MLSSKEKTKNFSSRRKYSFTILQKYALEFRLSLNGDGKESMVNSFPWYKATQQPLQALHRQFKQLSLLSPIHVTQTDSRKDPQVLVHKHSCSHVAISLDHQKMRLSCSGGEGGMFTWRWVQDSAWGNRLSFEVQVSINIWWSHIEKRPAFFRKPAAFVNFFLINKK